MEHSVPQNVTSFEFHLIGDMTLKQFAYLAAGLGSGYLTFVLLFSSHPFVAIPIIACFVVAGASFAFLPILDRPLDHWVIAFFKAVYSPTRGIWGVKLGPKGDLVFNESVFQNRLLMYLSGPGASPVITASPPPLPKLARITPPPAPSPVSTIESLQNQLNQIQVKLTDLKNSGQLNTDQIAPLVRQYSNISQNLQGMAKPVHTAPVPIPTPQSVPQPRPPILPPPPFKVKPEPKKQLTLTSFPNVINGVISDEEGNYTEGVIVIIHNSSGIPVRALKTNKLGQFTGATPLPAGVYTVTFEKEGFELGSLQVTLKDEVLQPLLLTTKKEKL